MSGGRGMPTSRAYWELRAEQMLNGLFSPQPAIDVEICDLPGGAAPADAPAAPTAAAPPQAGGGQGPWPWLVAATSLALLGATGLALSLGHWQQQQRSLREERDLLLLERLRQLGPASAPAAAPAAAAPAAAAPAVVVPPAAAPPAPDLGPAPATAPQADQPPPPSPDWIQQLPTLTPPAPRRAAAPAAPAPPQLVGVVQIPGRAAAAIFQQGEGSTTVVVGERIGSSGWRLRAASADGAVIEQAGQLRRLSLNGGSGGGG